MRKISLTLICLLACVSAFGQKSPLANAVILVIRHGEKPLQGTGLTAKGAARANAYVDYFKTYDIDGKPTHFNRLIATADTKKSYRERLTLEPLATALHQKLDMRFENKAVADLAKDLQTHPYGHEILICWHHGEIPNLVKELGGDPEKLFPGGKWPDAVFDWVVELHYDGEGHLASSKVVHENLKLSDGL